MSYDTELVHSVLDEAWFCHLSFVVDGEPRVLPTLHVRIGGMCFTCTGPPVAGRCWAPPAGEAGYPVCVAVTLIDGLVLARSQFHHSANYRSVVAHGRAPRSPIRPRRRRCSPHWWRRSQRDARPPPVRPP
jgi:nitroimidazol reductase NimA-like FMN-containing flavoprotein (pyridoxamine 5'-phosphate oxidase superfamily)